MASERQVVYFGAVVLPGCRFGRLRGLTPGLALMPCILIRLALPPCILGRPASLLRALVILG